LALWTALSVGWLLPSVGCQVEYAGMTLPSGKYMHDDVQYFTQSPNFPWANTQAATQRARMQAMGFEPAPLGSGPIQVPVAPGALPAVQGRMGRIQDVNQGGLDILPPLGPGGPAGNLPPPQNPAGGPPAPGGVPVPPPGDPGAPAGGPDVPGIK
jgi:hypothetical protein